MVGHQRKIADYLNEVRRRIDPAGFGNHFHCGYEPDGANRSATAEPNSFIIGFEVSSGPETQVQYLGFRSKAKARKAMYRAFSHPECLRVFAHNFHHKGLK